MTLALSVPSEIASRSNSFDNPVSARASATVNSNLSAMGTLSSCSSLARCYQNSGEIEHNLVTEFFESSGWWVGVPIKGESNSGNVRT